jgi:basic membrane protein A and related proteins
MRRLLAVLGALVVLHLLLLGVPARSGAAVRQAGAARVGTTRVGIVLDIGGRGDKSFNDGAYAGGERAARTLGADVRFIEPGDGSDREAGLRLLSAEGMQLVVGVGFIFSDDLTALAREYPRQAFAGIDFAVGDAPLPANLAAIKFREEEGSYLVGAIAALVGGSKRLGFVGGMDIPLIHKFEAGYRAGVARVCPDCTVVAAYAGATPEAFRNPERGKELALSEYGSGVTVIYQAAGATGLGVFEAARETGRLVIGTDADQSAEAPGHVVTSMVKRVDVATYGVIRDVRDGRFRGGVYSLGLAEGGVGYVDNPRLIPDSVRTIVAGLQADIIAGRIRVPTQ